MTNIVSYEKIENIEDFEAGLDDNSVQTGWHGKDVLIAFNRPTGDKIIQAVSPIVARQLATELQELANLAEEYASGRN